MGNFDAKLKVLGYESKSIGYKKQNRQIYYKGDKFFITQKDNVLYSGERIDENIVVTSIGDYIAIKNLGKDGETELAYIDSFGNVLTGSGKNLITFGESKEYWVSYILKHNELMVYNKRSREKQIVKLRDMIPEVEFVYLCKECKLEDLEVVCSAGYINLKFKDVYAGNYRYFLIDIKRNQVKDRKQCFLMDKFYLKGKENGSMVCIEYLTGKEYNASGIIKNENIKNEIEIVQSSKRGNLVWSTIVL